jgi:hypothetical protein
MLTRRIPAQFSILAARPKAFDSIPFKRPLSRRAYPALSVPRDPQDRILLPHPSDWRSIFSSVNRKDRISISNPQTAARIAKAFVPEGSENKVIIEAFPGRFPFPWCLKTVQLNRMCIRTWHVNSGAARTPKRADTQVNLDRRISTVPPVSICRQTSLFACFALMLFIFEAIGRDRPSSRNYPKERHCMGCIPIHRRQW